jgi:hypothetical protein
VVDSAAGVHEKPAGLVFQVTVLSLKKMFDQAPTDHLLRAR